MLVDGDLERRHFGVVVGYALAAGATLRRALGEPRAGLDIADKAVPDKTGLGALKLCSKYAVALVRHGIQRLTDFIDQVRSVSVAWLGSASSKITESATEVPVVTAPNGVRNCGRRLL